MKCVKTWTSQIGQCAVQVMWVLQDRSVLSGAETLSAALLRRCKGAASWPAASQPTAEPAQTGELISHGSEAVTDVHAALPEAVLRRCKGAATWHAAASPAAESAHAHEMPLHSSPAITQAQAAEPLSCITGRLHSCKEVPASRRTSAKSQLATVRDI